MEAWVIGAALAAMAAPVAAQDTTSLDIAGYDRRTGQTDDGIGLVVLCDPDAFRLSIRLADETSLDRSFSRRLLVTAGSLIQSLPGYSSEKRYYGPLTRYVQCGPYAIKLQGDVYNADPEGELGAYPTFVVVSIASDNRMIVPADARDAIAIGVCGRDDRRGRECPGGWATRIDLSYDPKAATILVEEQGSSVDSLSENSGTQQTRRRYVVDHSLAMWWERRADHPRRVQPSGTP